MSTRMPLPTARNAVPMAAVVLPLPGPVLTIIRPRRTSAIDEVLIVLSEDEINHREGLRTGLHDFKKLGWRDGRLARLATCRSNRIDSLNLDDTIVAIATPP